MRSASILLLWLLTPAASPQSASPPQRIVLSGDVQSAGRPELEVKWLAMGVQSLLHEQFVAYERAVIHNPADSCARGRLIAYHPVDVSDRELQDVHLLRIEHLVWMIEHHPEWDGFRVDPFKGFAEPRSPHERDIDNYKRLREAWLRRTGMDQQRAMVLHNAAMFFAIREPEFAVALLKRAMALEPSEDLYVERLGVVYALVQGRTDRLGKYGVVTGPERAVFARQARTMLLSSDNWLLVRGGAVSLGRCNCDVGNFSKELIERANTLSDKRELPSWSARYLLKDCDGYGSRLIGSPAPGR